MNGVFEAKIDLGNDAMKDPNDLILALRELIESLETVSASDWPLDESADTELLTRKIRDANGNTVGRWTVRPTHVG